MITGGDGADRRIRSQTVLPWAVLAVGVVSSILLFVVIHAKVETGARLRFERQAADAKGVIDGRIHFYADILYGLKALFATHTPVSRVQFHEFVQSLDPKNRYPGLDVVNYAMYVRAGDRRRFEEAVRRDISLDPRGYPQFAIKPPGERPEYYVMVYMEPMEGFEFAFGVDLGANPAATISSEKLTVLQRAARDSGNLTASGLPIRIRAGKEYIGLAMRLAVFRSGLPVGTVEQRRVAYIGSVGAGFNVVNLMKDVLEGETRQYMRFRLYDIGPAVEGVRIAPSETRRLLFDSDQPKHSGASQVADEPDSLFTQVLPMEVGGRTWEVLFSAPKSAVIDQLDRLLPAIVLVGGMLASILLSWVVYSLSYSRGQALALAERMTEDLRESEERFRLIAENASDLITVLDPQGRRVYANPAFGKLFGNVQPVIGIDAFQDIHPEDRERVRQSFLETVRDGRNSHSEFRILLPSGEARDIETYRSAVLEPQGRVERVVAVSRDVTERRRTEEALRARDVQLQEAQALANLGSWEWDLRTNSRTWSEQLTRIFGLRHDQLPSTFDGFYPLVHPDDRERTAKLASEALRTGKSYENQFRIVRPDGLVRTLHNQARVDRDESGRAVRVIGVCQDITERKLAEEQVRISQERFRMMVENVRDYAIYMLDMKGYITSWNLGAERIEGYLADEIIGKHYSRFFLPDHATRGDPGMQLQFASLQGRYESEGWRVRKNGSQFWAHVILTPLRDETGKLRGFSEIVHDITDRKRVEEDLHSYADRLKTTSRRLVEVQES